MTAKALNFYATYGKHEFRIRSRLSLAILQYLQFDFFRLGHAGIALRLSRIQAPLDSEKCLELGHHILKAHIYRNMTLHKTSPRDLQAFWVCSSAKEASTSLGSLRNIYNPNVKVCNYLPNVYLVCSSP